LTTSVPVDPLEDLKDLDEEVDDVQVELNGGGDVLLRGDPGHDHLQTRQMAGVLDEPYYSFSPILIHYDGWSHSDFCTL
jgi:hypothetical protein